VTDRSSSAHWNQRYATADYYYGTEPNDFLREQAHRIRPSGSVLCLAEGEGRNAVFLAAQGHDVVALDSSSAGLAKAECLARERAVIIQTVLADLTAYPLGTGTWDGVVSIWCHLPADARRALHRDVVAALRPGGVFLLESYTPAQLALKTGGPQTADLLPRLDALREELDGLSFDIAIEREREIHEGRGHNGRSAVVQILATKPL
jgi:SAM-dependent methyltransferase